MTSGPVKSWVDRLLELALTLVAIGLLLQWAWQLLRPLLPMVIGGIGLVALGRYVIGRHRTW